MMRHTMSLPSINLVHLMVSKIEPGRNYKIQGHKVKSRSHHDVANLHTKPITNFLYLTDYEIYQDKILKVNVTTERSNQGYTIMFHTYTHQPLSWIL